MRAGRACKRRRRKQRARKAPAVVVDGNARMAHTSNMPVMLMTLDVLMLSGWLNELAPCRVEKEA